MDGEIKSLIKTWISVLSSLCYCYFISRKIPKGKFRLLSLLPIFHLFTVLPMTLSTVMLSGITALSITWLANFKLLLFAFGQGPLSDDYSSSLLRFISLACLPIKINQTPSPQITKHVPKSSLDSAIKALLLAILIYTYNYGEYINSNIILLFKCCFMYLALDIPLAIAGFLARTLLSLELEPQFNKPYLSTSLQDFWGRRWNLVVSTILSQTVYKPIRSFSVPVLGTRSGQVLGVVSTFVVSGLMHELIFYYITRVDPTWEVTCFFVLHGICTAVEIAAKKGWTGRRQLHRAVSGPLTVGFVLVTASWLFIPQLARNGLDIRAVGEWNEIIEFVKEKILQIFIGSNATVHHKVVAPLS
ncbi:hypothetical protein HHK36_023943 [Tetracentron sinense]|uniref:Wax synthase domain-containing protein n=1 Tax=Tetracentron sinense TaxID=13715 RepID=A0A835D8D2_TETSI|nr:hypothetical protein HHK36_023943 [Tetracentron sinense]